MRDEATMNEFARTGQPFACFTVDNVHPDSTAWQRALALLDALALDPRKFDLSADCGFGAQLLKRQAHYLQAQIPFAASSVVWVQIPLDDEIAQVHFCRAIDAACQSTRFRAQARLNVLAVLLSTERGLAECRKWPDWIRIRNEARLQQKVDSLKQEFAAPRFDDLPSEDCALRELADDGLSARMCEASGLDRFNTAVMQMAQEAHERRLGSKESASQLHARERLRE